MKTKIYLLILFCLFLRVYSQCTTCTVTNPVGSNYTFAAGGTYCFTTNTTFSDVTFNNNVKICIAQGVNVTIQNNINSNQSQKVTFEIAGTLQFNQSPQINADLTINITGSGLLKAGSSGGNNFTFNGNGTNTLTNYGIVQVGVLGFNSNAARNIIDNYGIYTIGGNINISGTTTFRNNGNINIGSSYNNNPTSTYINCGTITSAGGYNLGGGKVINTGTFNVPGGSIDMSNSSRMDNYGMMTLLGTLNLNSTQAILFNQGLLRISNANINGGNIIGPSSSSKKGFVYTTNSYNPNNLKIGPNLDFTRYTSNTYTTTSSSQGQSAIFNSAPVYINSNGTTVSQTTANVTYACTNCAVNVVTAIGECPQTDGTFPPMAIDDYFTISAGEDSGISVLNNDLLEYNGVAATLSNINLTQISTTNSNVYIDLATGLVKVNPGTPGGLYTIVYQICKKNSPTSCDTATVTVSIPPPPSYCTKPPTAGTPDSNTKVGISTFSKKQNGWPENVPNGHLVLESNNKGLVITRTVASAITNPILGMLIYDTTDKCIKVYTVNNSTNTNYWHCIQRTCNE